MDNKTFRVTDNAGYNAKREYALKSLGLEHADLDLITLELEQRIKNDRMVMQYSNYTRVKRIGTWVYVQIFPYKLPNGGDLDRAMAKHLHAIYGGMTTSDEIRHSKRAIGLNPKYRRYWGVCLDWVKFETEYKADKTIQQIERDYK